MEEEGEPAVWAIGGERREDPFPGTAGRYFLLHRKDGIKRGNVA